MERDDLTADAPMEEAIALIRTLLAAHPGTVHDGEAQQIIGNLQETGRTLRRYEENRGRLNHLIDLLLEYTVMDFSRKAPLSDRGDELDALAAGLNSLTEEIRYSSQLLNNKIKQLDEAQRLTHIGSWEWDVVNDRINWSDELLRIYGLERGHFSENYQNYLKYVHPDDRETVEQTVRKAFADRRPFTFVHRLLRQNDGELRVLDCTGVVTTDADGRVLRMTGTAQDITERQKTEEAKSHAEQERQRALEALHFKQQFLSNMSHEIRTPLTAIIGFTKVVLKSSLDDKQRQYLNAIKISGDALLALVNDILDFSKVNAGKMVFEETPFNPRMAMENILQLFETKALHKNIAIANRFDDAIPEMVVGDPLRLNQVILNLVSNAIKFTEEGTISLWVQVSGEDEDTVTLSFSVADTGVGIEPQNLGRIFDSFQQASSQTSRLFGGTGLGLAIVKQLVEAQNGRVSVESVWGKGSTFTFCLPFKKAEPDAECPAPASEDVTPTHTDEIRVLVVDDVALNQLLMKVVMTNLGFVPDIAENGRVAVEKLKTNTYDMVLMDLHMPVMDGFGATRYIRNELCLDVPIIALTADVTSPEIRRTAEVGMDDFVTKPINQNKLYLKIMQVLEARKNRALSQP